MLHQIWRNTSSAYWPLMTQLALRGSVAAKFFIAATQLGPSAIGVASVSLICLAILEAITDTGITQAIVQRKEEPTATDLGWALRTQLIRGLVVAILLAAGARQMSEFMNSPPSENLFYIAAVICLIKGFDHPSLILLQRNQTYKKAMVIDVSSSVTDFAATIILLSLGAGPEAILLGTTAGEFTKLIASWASTSAEISLQSNKTAGSTLLNFGRWIWLSSIVSLLLNQLDRVLLSRSLGPTELGVYQVGSKIAQLCIAEVPISLGQYLLAKFSKQNRSGTSLVRINEPLKKISYLTVVAAVVLVLIVQMPLLQPKLSKWPGIVSIVTIQAISMVVYSLIAVYVSYLRGIGRPQIVTYIAGMQLVLAVGLLLHAASTHKMENFALATLLAQSFALMLFAAYTRRLS